MQVLNNFVKKELANGSLQMLNSPPGLISDIDSKSVANTRIKHFGGAC